MNTTHRDNLHLLRYVKNRYGKHSWIFAMVFRTCLFDAGVWK